MSTLPCRRRERPPFRQGPLIPQDIAALEACFAHLPSSSSRYGSGIDPRTSRCPLESSRFTSQSPCSVPTSITVGVVIRTRRLRRRSSFGIPLATRGMVRPQATGIGIFSLADRGWRFRPAIVPIDSERVKYLTDDGNGRRVDYPAVTGGSIGRTVGRTSTKAQWPCVGDVTDSASCRGNTRSSAFLACGMQRRCHPNTGDDVRGER